MMLMALSVVVGKPCRELRRNQIEREGHSKSRICEIYGQDRTEPIVPEQFFVARLDIGDGCKSPPKLVL